MKFVPKKEDLACTQVSTKQIDKMFALKDKFLIALANRYLHILNIDTLEPYPDNKSPSDINEYQYSVQGTSCYFILYHGKKISKYELNMDSGSFKVYDDKLAEPFELAIHSLIAGPNLEWMAWVQVNKLYLCNYKYDDNKYDFPFPSRTFPKQEGRDYYIRIFNLARSDKYSDSEKILSIEFELIEGALKFKWYDAEGQVKKEKDIIFKDAKGFNRQDTFYCDYAHPFIYMVFHKNIYLFTFQDGEMVWNSKNEGTDKIRCVTDFDETNKMYMIVRSKMCSLQLDLTDNKTDELIRTEKFEEAELLFKIKKMKLVLTDSEETIKNLERETYSKLAYHSLHPNCQRFDLSSGYFSKVEVNIKFLMSIFPNEIYKWISTEDIGNKLISISKYLKSQKEEYVCKEMYSIVDEKYNKFISKEVNETDEIPFNLVYSNDFFLNSSILYNQPIKQGEYIKLVEKSMAYLMIKKNTYIKLFEEIKSKKDFRFRKLEFKDIGNLDKIIKIDNQFLYLSLFAFWFNNHLESVNILCNYLRTNKLIEKKISEFIAAVIEQNLIAMNDNSSKFVVVKNWFGEIVNLDRNRFYDKFIDIVFESTEMLQELVKRIEDYDSAQNTNLLREFLNEIILYLKNREFNVQKKKNLDEKLLYTKYLLEELKAFFTKHGQYGFPDNQEVTTFRTKFKKELEAHYQKFDRSELILYLNQSDLKDELIFMLTVDGKIEDAMKMIKNSKDPKLNIDDYIQNYRNYGTLEIWLNNKIKEYTMLVDKCKQDYRDKNGGSKLLDLEVEYEYSNYLDPETQKKIQLLKDEIKKNVNDCLKMGVDSIKVLENIPGDLDIAEIVDEVSEIYSMKYTEYYNSEFNKKMLDLYTLNKEFNNRMIMDDYTILVNKGKNNGKNCCVCQKKIKKGDIWLWYPNNKMCHMNCASGYNNTGEYNKDPQSDLEFLNYYWL